MTEAILSIFRRRRKPIYDAVFADRLRIARHYVRRAGDEVRDLDRWKRDYSIRTGRVA